MVAVLLLLAPVVELIRACRVRAAAAIAATVVTGALLVVLVRFITAQWEPILRELGLLTRFLPENEGRDAVAAALDTMRVGFWLVLTVLVAIVVGNVLLLFRRGPGHAAGSPIVAE